VKLVGVIEQYALLSFVNRDPHVPTEPPSLRETTRLVASLGGFLGRNCDDEPGTQTLRLELLRLDDITAMYQVFTIAFARPPPAVSSGRTYG
jgi:transposase Tn5 family protein